MIIFIILTGHLSSGSGVLLLGTITVSQIYSQGDIGETGPGRLSAGHCAATLLAKNMVLMSTRMNVLMERSTPPPSFSRVREERTKVFIKELL
ncbi:MAG TPA: hypothetical protein PLQ21_01985 [Candidatus Kapabacteria bacterium]|nr:hypothetical protein [Candidatus Kapabacteria bacterium]